MSSEMFWPQYLSKTEHNGKFWELLWENKNVDKQPVDKELSRQIIWNIGSFFNGKQLLLNTTPKSYIVNS